MKPLRILVLYAIESSTSTFSYQVGWPRHLANSGLFSATLLNLWALNWDNVTTLAKRLLNGKQFDAIVILHSAFSNANYLRKVYRVLIGWARRPVAYFVGNEYKLMPEKMAMCEEVGVRLLVTMNVDERAQQLYRERLGVRVVCIPSAGVDTEIFYPKTPLVERDIDIGYRADDDPHYFLHNDSRLIAEYFLQFGLRYGLKLDVSMDSAARFKTKDWANFLNRCRGQIGVERGSCVFELTDSLRRSVNAYVIDHPETTHDTVIKLFGGNVYSPIPGRMLTGRHTEAAACKTVQILFPGRYNDYFQEDKHYIPLKNDFSNIDEVVRKFRDEAYCKEITDQAYDVVWSELTYARLIEKFYFALRQVL